MKTDPGASAGRGQRARRCAGVAITVWAAAMLTLTGCAARAEGQVGATQDAGARQGASLRDGREAVRPESDRYERGRVMLDGLFDDWPEGVVALADADYVYLRFSPGEEASYAIQAAPEQVVLHLDMDGRAETGRGLQSPPAAAHLGIDLEVRFSPRVAGGRGSGVMLRAFDASGQATTIRHADADFMASPTYANPWYEARISRHLAGVDALAGRIESGTARGIVTIYDAQNRLVGYADPFETALPPRAPAPPRAEAVIPPHPAGGLRIVNYNVEHAAPMNNPGPFANILNALDPDVVLVQEWTSSTEAEIRAWFNAMLPASGPWHVVRNETWGVAVVSRYPAENLFPAPIRRQGGATVRFVGARLHTSVGEAIVGSLHLKCCGGAGTSEDATRIAEAEAIADALAGLLADDPAAIRVIGGDVNLVGTRTPLDRLVAGLDVDGSDLTPAFTPVLGDHAVYTWTHAPSSFAPGRLDWGVYGQAGAELVHAFALDTRRLGSRTLARYALEHEDAAASDHVPVVLDLVPRD